MSQITLVRHGQANTEARDEQSYDKLSDLGHQQAAWLGDHLRDSGGTYSRVYCGTLVRHVETATSMGFGDHAVQDARLNEMAYFTLAQLLEDQHNEPIPTLREDFVYHLPKVLSAWRDGRIEGAPERFDEFEARVSDAMHDILSGDGPALVVTSGGLIAMVVRQTMQLDIPAMARTALAIMNTSVHRLHVIGDVLAPVQFNAIPHLEHVHRQFAQTHL